MFIQSTPITRSLFVVFLFAVGPFAPLDLLAEEGTQVSSTESDQVFDLGLACPITAITSLSESQFAVGSQAGIRLYSWPSLNEIGELPTHLEQINCLQVDSTSQLLWAAGGIPGEIGQIESWHWIDEQLATRRIVHDDVVSDFSFDASRDRTANLPLLGLSTASIDGRANVYRESSTLVLKEHSASVLAIERLPKDGLVISAGRDQTLRVWDAETGELVRTLNNHTDEVRCLAAQPDTNGGRSGLSILASAGADSTVRIWQPTIGRLVRFARLESQPVCMMWNQDGTRIAVGCEDGNLRIVDASNVSVVETVALFDDWIYSISHAPDGTILVGSSEGRIAHLSWPDED